MRSLSLREKVGQLFMVGFEATQVTSELIEWLSTYGWGGLIIFGRNVESPVQLQRLIQGIQAHTAGPDEGPILIAVDQEGGRVARLGRPFTQFPSASTIGRSGSEVLAEQVGSALGRELRAVGITMDMAPVLDVLTNDANTVIGDRAFGSCADCVARLGRAFISGMHMAGVVAVGKHFPGHGDTKLDSHVALPRCERTLDQLNTYELGPFRAAIAGGLQAMMTAHVVYPAWDMRHPATLSPGILRGILRRELGFQGVIISDDLGMAAVADTVPWEEIPLQALRAGVDVLLICHGRERQELAYKRVLQAVRCGELPELLIEQALARVLMLKSRLRSVIEDTAGGLALSTIGDAAHQALAETARAQGATSTAERHLHG